MRSIELWCAIAHLRIWRSGAYAPSRNGMLDVSLPPPPMQPQPLFGIFADPAFHDVGDRLHRALNVDLAGCIEDRFDFLGQFGAKAVAGQADDACTVNWTVDLPPQAGQHRIGPGLAA